LLDYQKQVATDLQSGDTSTITLPKSNVLQFVTADGSKISARPSGTEPKIKFYFSVNTQLHAIDEFEQAQQRAKEKIERIIADMKLK
jgi:phosphoglucomutase